MWQLIISGPGYFDTAYDLLDGETMLGRGEDNDIVLSGDSVSRRHARLVARNGLLLIEDLGSRNGSRLNEQTLQGMATLNPGDVVRMGENTLAVRKGPQSTGAAVESGKVRRFGEGQDIASAVLMSKSVHDSVLLRALDNVGSREMGPPPLLTGALGGIDYKALALLYKVAESLGRAKSLHAFLEETVDRLMERVDATTAVVLLRRGSGVLAPSVVRHRGKLEQGEVPVSDAIIAEALSRGAGLVVSDVQGDHRFARRESVLLYGAEQVLCIPLGETSPFSGVLYINRKANGVAPAEQLLELCAAVSQLIAVGAERFRLLEQHRGEERLRSVLERHYGPALVDGRLEQLSLEPPASETVEQRPATLLAVELVGAGTVIQHGSARAVQTMLEDFGRRAAGLLFSFDGAVARFEGASLLALFGAPVTQGGEALKAVRAALALRREWHKAMEAHAPELRCPLKIALHTGNVLSGRLNLPAVWECITLGEPVNVVLSLCASAEASQVLVSGKTLAAIGARFDANPLGERMLKGGKERVSVFELIDEDIEDQFTHPGLR